MYTHIYIYAVSNGETWPPVTFAPLCNLFKAQCPLISPRYMLSLREIAPSLSPSGIALSVSSSRCPENRRNVVIGGGNWRAFTSFIYVSRSFIFSSFSFFFFFFILIEFWNGKRRGMRKIKFWSLVQKIEIREKMFRFGGRKRRFSPFSFLFFPLFKPKSRRE